MKVVFAIISCSLLYFETAGQPPAGAVGEKITTLALSDTIVDAAIDRPGDFYAVTAGGQIQRFDKDGNLTLLFKADTTPTLFDPRDGARLFAYYRGDQHYEFLNPSFQVTASYKIDPAFAIQPWLICPSGEYKLWVLDRADQSLKKVDVKSSVVEVEVVIDSTVIENAEAFRSMREYQNFLFALNPGKGLFIFNSLGKHIRTIDRPGIEAFNFLGEELYYLREDTLEFFNLFTTDTRQMKLESEYTDVLLTDERMILFAPDRIDIFVFRP
jgi:hypothetical protein